MMSRTGGLRWRSGRAISRIALIALVLGGTFAAFIASSETAADSHTSALTLIVSRGLTTFKEGSPALHIEPTLVLEGAGVSSATVEIASSDLTDGDQLAFTNDNSTMGDIAGTYNAGTLSLTGTATVVQWRNALRVVTFYTNSTSPTSRSDSRTIEWSIVDSLAKTKTGTTTFTIDPMNDAPVIAAFNPVAVNASTTTLLAPSATLSDNDSANLNGGNITVTGAITGDVVSINPDTAAVDGAIRSNGGNVERNNGANWSIIGTHSGGTASTFTVQFTSTSVTPSIAQSVLRAIRITVDATEQTRTFVITANDGDGGTSSTASVNFASSPTLAVAISLLESTDAGASKTDLLTNDSFLLFQVAKSNNTNLDESRFSAIGSGTPCSLLYDVGVPNELIAMCNPGTVAVSYGPSSSPEVTIDAVAPEVTLSTTTASTTGGTVIDFVVAGNEPLNCASVDKANFNTVGLSGLTTPEPLGDGTCGFSGISSVAPGATGSSGISGVSVISITDLAGNTATSVTGAPTATVNRAFPTVTGIALKTSSDTGVSNSDGVSNASTLEYDVSFSESVVAISANDFGNDGTATGCEFVPSANTGSSIVVAVSACTEGTVVLVLNASTVTGVHGDGPASNASATGISVDRTAPTVTALTPVSGATAIDIDDNLSLTFSEAVTTMTGDVVIRTSSAVAATIAINSGFVSGSGTSSVSINPATDFSEGTDYYVLIDSTAFIDTAGNSFAGISSPTAWRFQTVEAAPIVATTTTLPTEATEPDAVVTTTTTTTTTVAGAAAVTTTSVAATTTEVSTTVVEASAVQKQEDVLVQSPKEKDAAAELVAPTTTLIDDVSEVLTTQVTPQDLQVTSQNNEGTNAAVLVAALLGAVVLMGGALQLLRKGSR
jgi:large repetitive protein